MSLRADLQQIIDEIDAAERQAEALVAPLTDAQFFFAPPLPSSSRGVVKRGWGIAQCLDHLATINAVYCRPIRAALVEARQRGLTGGGPIASSFVGRKFIASQEPPVKRKLLSPAKGRPASTGPRSEIMAAYRTSHDTIRALARDCAAIDVNRATFKNPFLPIVRVRVGTGLRVMTAHERRHLWQAEQVMKADGFPR
jgi:hypothetical protein